MDCGGRAQRRHRFGRPARIPKSGVALRFPPESKKSGSLDSVVAAPPSWRRRFRIDSVEPEVEDQLQPGQGEENQDGAMERHLGEPAVQPHSQ